MPFDIFDALGRYWSEPMLSANVIITLHLFGALFLGLLVGYERSYHGRAAGMRTYGIVCMASAALTVFAGFPEYWFGGHAHAMAAVDPTRVIQGIVTGVGFLGAGVIMKEGMSISGLTTAASIWAASAIGVLVGLGLYISAIAIAVLMASLMMWGSKIESRLPSRPAIAVTLRFKPGFVRPQESLLRQGARERGYSIATGSFSVACEHGQIEWHFVAVALDGVKSTHITDLADELSKFDGVEKLKIEHARN